MREIKFRAWWKDTKRFLDGDEWYMTCSGAKHLHYAVLPYNDDDFTIEQYTGLKDKNGKEIYEGDILGGIWEDGYIAYCDKCKQFQYHCNGVGCMACSGDVQWYELVDDKELEVIGNIHENPELLEEE